MIAAPITAAVNDCIGDLQYVAEWLRGQIDGSVELESRDRAVSGYARSVERAASMLASFEKYRASIDAAIGEVRA